jgi:hypothetical protein
MHNLIEHRLRVLRQTQFYVLFRVFFLRVVDLDLLASDADPTRLIGQFITLFASISFFFTLPSLLVLMSSSSPSISAQWTTEHLFLETSMTVAGLITLLNLDSAFPDRRDLLVLAPLPVRPLTLFTAKTAALFGAPGLAVLSLNAFSGVTWPVCLIAHGTGFFGALRAWPAYWLTLFAGGAFVVLSILGLYGLAANLLPRQIFLRLSALLQAAGICLLLSVYFLGPSLETPAALTAAENQHALAFLPAYWFLGFFEQLNGAPHPALAPLARRAWIGLAIAALATIAASLLSYRRTMTRTVEQPDILPTRRIAWLPLIGTPLQSAITLFSLRTLLRSRQHRMILSGYLGVGLAIVLGYIRTPFAGIDPVKSGIDTVFLLSGILLTMLTLLALRVVASIPIALKAHWLFRLTRTRPAALYYQAVRFSWLVIAIAPILLLLSASFAFYPWQQVLGHLTAMLLLGILIMELSLFTFQKIPFTCSYLPGKANIHFVFWISLVVCIRVLKDAAEYEGRMLRDLPTFLVATSLLAVLAATMHWFNRSRIQPDDDLVFEEEEAVEMVWLKLT